MKTAFIISGLSIHATALHEVNMPILKAVEQKGYKAVPVDISWRQTTLTQFASRFINIYHEQKGSYNVLVGNSFGAMVEVIVASELNPDKIILCSLSPFFKENGDSSWLNRAEAKKFGKRRLRDAGKYSLKSLAQSLNILNTKVVLLYGSKENETSPRLVEHVQSVSRMLPKAKLVELPDAPHQFSDPSYIKGIVAEL